MKLSEFPLPWFEKAAPYKLFWIGVPLALYSWSIFGPFISDDLHLLLKSERYLRGETKSLELYRFATSDRDWQEIRDRGNVPWWTPNSVRLDFFRPVSELLFYVDVVLFGRNAIAHRLMGLVTLLLALICVHRLFECAGGGVIRSGAATFLYGVSQTVTPPATWMCNRQDLFVVIGVSIAAAEYWKLRGRSSIRGVAIGAIAFAFALLSKEVAIALIPQILFFDFMAHNREVSKGTAWTRRIFLLINCTLGSAYLVYYAITRPWAFNLSGADGTSSQISTGLPLSLLLYASAWALSFPIDILNLFRPFHIAALGTLTALVMLFCLYELRKRIRHDTSVLFFILWSILFIAPGLRSLTPSTRTLCTASVGWAYLVATLICTESSTGARAPLLLRSFLYATNCTISICCVIGTILFMNASENAACGRIKSALQQLSTPLQDGDAMVFERAEAPFESICAGDRLEYISGRRNVSVHYLLANDVKAEFSVTDPHCFVASALDQSLFDTTIHRLSLGPQWRPSVGKEFKNAVFSANIVEVIAPDRVQRIRFCFDLPLNSPRLHFEPTKISGS